jgi:hypothetical protein
MQRNLLWSGREYYSLENCVVNTTKAGSEINSTIIGQYVGKIYKVEYQIRTNQDWETVFVEIKSQHSNRREHFVFESDGKGNWMNDGNPARDVKGCIDIDIPLTPFTNALPIRRLNLSQNTTQQIRVIYFDLLEQQVRPVHQKYTRLSNTSYRYENVPNDFEATIEVDDFGFVVNYPLLFVRRATLETNYPDIVSPK